MSWGIVAVVGGTLAGGLLSSNATEKQSEIQADSIAQASQVDQAAINKTISQIMADISPVLAQFNESMQGSIDLLESGRISTADLLNQSANNISNIAVQGGQQALNALLGTNTQATPANQPTQQPTVQTLPTAPQPSDALPQAPTTQPIQGEFGQGIAPQSFGPTQNQPISNQPTELPLSLAGPDVRAMIDSAQGDQTISPQQTQTTLPPQTPLEGELLPRDYNFNQGQVNLPSGDFGLAGTEQAINQGADLGRTDLMTGAQTGMERLGSRFDTARGDVVGGRDFALNKVQQAIDASRGGINRGVGTIQQGTRAGVDAINRGVGQGIGFLSPYMQAGQEALDPLAALSGIRGQEAFDAALLDDPAHRYNITQADRALGRQAAVTGGFGSGNVKARAIQQSQDLSAANIDRQLARIRDIRNSGQAAAGTAGGFATQGGIASGNLEAQGGINAGNLQARGGELEASLLDRAGQVGMQSSQQLSQIAQQLGLSESQVLNMLGQNLSNIDVNTGNQIGGARETAGINAANIMQGITGQQIGTEQNLSQALAGLDQNTIANIVNSIQQGAGTNLSANQNLSNQIANLTVGAGSNQAQSIRDIGTANAAGITNPWGNAIDTGIGLYAGGAFDNQAANSGGGNNAIGSQQFIDNNQGINLYNQNWGT